MPTVTTPALLELFNTLIAASTAIGVFIAGRQLFLSKRLAVTQFEDQFSTQYRELIRRVPVKALLGHRLSDDELREALPAFYHYFDLSNEQVFLREKGRIGDDTWEEWKVGIQQNLKRPAFLAAWSYIASQAPDSFDELRRIVPPGPTPGRLGAGDLLPGSAPKHG